MELIYFLLFAGLVGLIFFVKKFMGTSKLKPIKCQRKVKHGAVCYKFLNGLCAEMHPLTVDQDLKLLELLGQVKMGDIQKIEEIDFGTAINFIKEQRHKILDIILINKKTPSGEASEYYGSLQTQELGVVWNDFFSLNPLARRILRRLKIAVAMEQQSKTNLKGSKV